MSPSITNLKLLESYNLYPDCLSLNLTLNPLPIVEKETNQFSLYLDLFFGEQSISLLTGKVNFGIKGGELSLHLFQCQLLLESTQSEQIVALKPRSEITATDLYITTNEQLKWLYTVEPRKMILQGLLSEQKLGEIKPTADFCHIFLNFKVSLADIYITDTEDLWRHDITPNKHSILDRAIARFILESKIKSSLSWLSLASNADIISTELKTDKNTKITFVQGQLEELIPAIYQYPSDDFLELAKLAKLNCNTDFAGANLLGTNLSSIDLSGSNLERVNCRGADLTDADLSETKLKSARLSGADLSGAYLENADLRDADLHGASLALANLIGADLSSANLHTANLSNTNFTMAKVEKTRFSNNTGISEEMKTNLIARGAIFS